MDFFDKIKAETERKSALHDKIAKILDKHGIEIRIESYDAIEVTFKYKGELIADEDRFFLDNLKDE